MSEAPKRILVVEDEWLVALDTLDMLERAGCVVIGPVATVAEALTIVDSEQIDAAVLDVRLATETTFPIAEALMARHAPFVFVTGLASSDLPAKFRECRMVSKPVAERALRAALGVQRT